MEYLDETRPEPPLFPRNDPFKKALVGKPYVNCFSKCAVGNPLDSVWKTYSIKERKVGLLLWRSARQKFGIYKMSWSESNGPFAAERSRGTNRQTGEQMTHWEMLNKATNFEFSLFNMSPCVICFPVWRFLYHVITQLQRAHCHRKSNYDADVLSTCRHSPLPSSNTQSVSFVNEHNFPTIM